MDPQPTGPLRSPTPWTLNPRPLDPRPTGPSTLAPWTTPWTLDPFAHVLDFALALPSALALAQAGSPVCSQHCRIRLLTSVKGDFSRFLQIFLLHGRSHSATTWKHQFVGYFSGYFVEKTWMHFMHLISSQSRRTAFSVRKQADHLNPSPCTQSRLFTSVFKASNGASRQV